MRPVELWVFCALVLCGVNQVRADGDDRDLPKETANVQKPISPGPNAACDISPVAIDGLSIEGQDTTNDPYGSIVNASFSFKDGPTEVINGKPRTSIIISESILTGFSKNWINEGANSLAASIRNSLSESCSNSLGATSVSVPGYYPPQITYSQNITKRQCTSLDLPCGIPETTCTGGSLPSCSWKGCSGGSLPSCTTRTPMCRTEQKVDVFSATVNFGFQLLVGIKGQSPSQTISVTNNVNIDEVQASQGELTKLLDGVGLSSALRIGKVNDFGASVQTVVDQNAALIGGGTTSFPILTADYIYLPQVKSVNWSQSADNMKAVPYAILLQRESTLPTSLACRVIKCIRDSQSDGKLLVKSCKLN